MQFQDVLDIETEPLVGQCESQGRVSAAEDRPRVRTMPFVLRGWRGVVRSIVLHALLVAAGYGLSFLIRFDFAIPVSYASRFLLTLPVVVALRMVVLGAFGLFRGSWRYAGAADLASLVKANTLASGLILAVLFVSGLLNGFPRSVLLLDWLLSFLFLGGARLFIRMLNEHRLDLKAAVSRPGAVPVVVIGAGNAGERLVRELLRDRSGHIAPVALVDDDPSKLGLVLHGVSVVGATDELGDVVKSTAAKRAIIAMPSATREQVARIVARCRKVGVPCQIVPSLPELLSGSARLSQVRDVQVEDLLGRTPIQLDVSSLRRSIAGKVVLITGGAGSIGSELARQVAGLGPARLVLFEQAESPLYFIHLEIAAAHPEVEVIPVVGDVTDRVRTAEVFKRHRPHYVLHAAAYKHVPLMEDNVVEAVRNNVLGTLCVADNAARYGAQKFVLISTDKAVRPSSVMGATKRIGERIVLGWPSLVGSGTDFRAVRFGNVLGSDGSVIPLFKRQLARGGPLTVTHPEVTRYFMTIPEASQLVLTAAILPEAAGRVSMLEMGEPVRIRDLAENLIRLSGLEPGVDVDITYTGLRPGEKLYEELMGAVEATVPTQVEKIRIVQTVEQDAAELTESIGHLFTSQAAGDRQQLLEAIVRLVPECVSPLRERGAAGVRPRPAQHRSHAAVQKPLETPFGRDKARHHSHGRDSAPHASAPTPAAPTA